MVYYEWDVEEVTTEDSANHEESEVLEHFFQTSYAECMDFVKRHHCQPGTEFQIVLVRDDDRRSWAYLEDNKILPEYAEDAYQNDHGKIPKRYHDEVRKYHEKSL